VGLHNHKESNGKQRKAKEGKRKQKKAIQVKEICFPLLELPSVACSFRKGWFWVGDLREYIS
jgi:hypothetical protein